MKHIAESGPTAGRRSRSAAGRVPFQFLGSEFFPGSEAIVLLGGDCDLAFVIHCELEESDHPIGILFPLALPPDDPHPNRCGSCIR